MTKEINVQQHILVPKHILLSPEEASAILERYNIGKTQLPMISAKDPAVLHLDPKSGDIIKIERNSPTNGSSLFFRRIVE